MKIFDLHCDTIEALKNNNETFDSSITQFTMKGQEKLDKAVQFLAVWVPDHLRGQEAVDFTNGYYEDMKEAVKLVSGKAETECSGNVTKENVERLVDIGVDYISSGALTHSSPILDLSLKNLHAI